MVALAMEKGGVAKTTSAVNIAAALALKGKRVLLVDSDPQANATAACYSKELEGDLYTVYGEDELTAEALMNNVIVETEHGFHLLPSSRDLSGIEGEALLKDNPAYGLLLAKTLEPVRDLFEYIIIDSPPNLGTLTANALVAATDVMIPLQPEMHAVDGLGSLIDTISKVRVLNPYLNIAGIFLTMVERNSLHRDIEEDARSSLTEMGVKVFDTKIKRTIKFGQAADRGRPAVLEFPKHHSVRAYLDLVEEAFDV
ncbi:ParA family protein [Tumebacillus sp. DT12]|uniref:ParA family protein n=1 Tax=Tumebacillus lacus TaxID=2995335 RepID=A0ABT3X0C7_9BACL|nr:ParA family protein [Tumebacillus lacus]